MEARGALGDGGKVIMKTTKKILRHVVLAVAGGAVLGLTTVPVSAQSWDYERYRGGYDGWLGEDWYYDYYESPSHRSAGGWRSKSDRQLKEDVKSELTWSPFVDADSIDVSVKNGEVTLRGTVEDRNEAEAAIENAYEAGARRVISRLKTEEGSEG
jgi:hypothetical protein